MASHFIALGEDSVRTDTLFASFKGPAIPDSTIDSAFRVGSSAPIRCGPRPGSWPSFSTARRALLYGIPWPSIRWRAGSPGSSPAQDRAGDYQYYYQRAFALRNSHRHGHLRRLLDGAASAQYSTAASPAVFRLRDPFLLQSIALVPQRLEADTSLYSLGARDLFQVQMRGENGRGLDAHFDVQGGVRATPASRWPGPSPTRTRPRLSGLSLAADTAAALLPVPRRRRPLPIPSSR